MYRRFLYLLMLYKASAVDFPTEGTLPKIQEFIFSRDLLFGEDAKVMCAVTQGQRPLTFEWLKGSIPVHELRGKLELTTTEDTSILSIKNLDAEDVGNYTCRVRNARLTTSHTSMLTIKASARWLSEPSNTDAVQGLQVNVPCSATGLPVPKITWKKLSSEGERTFQESSAAGNLTLRVAAVESKDGGRFECRASNGVGADLTKTIVVRIHAHLPVINPFVFPEGLREGQQISVVCTVLEGDGPLTFTWLKDGKTLPKDVQVTAVKESVSLLTTDKLTAVHAGNYTCSVSGPAGTAQHSALLRVHTPVRWLTEPQNQSTNERSSVVIKCSALGMPQPRVIWKNKKPGLSQKSEWLAIIENGRKRVSTNGDLSIDGATWSDGGQYKCEASNGAGPVISKEVTLTVHVPARFEEKFVSKTVRKSESARLTCEARGDQPLSIGWKFQGVEFRKEGNGRYEIFETLTEKGLSSEFLLREVDRNDGGVYTCSADNPYGTDERTIKVSVLEVPSQPIELRVLEVWSRSVSLAWSEPFSGNSPVTQYHVQYWGNYQTARRLEELVVTATQTTALVKGLHPGTHYASSLVAENSVGRSNPSETIYFITGEEEPSGAPVDVTVKPRGTSTFHITWKAPPQDEWNGKLTGFYVGFKSRGTSQPYSFKTVDFNVAAEMEYLLTSLRKDTEYGIVVQAFNSAGSGPASQEIVIRTLGGDLPSPPTPYVVRTAPFSITIQWTQITSQSSIEGYVVHYKKENSTWQQYPVIPPSQSSYTLNDLDPSTVYLLYMTTTNSFGEGDPSHSVTIKTDGPGKPMVVVGQAGAQFVPVFSDLSLLIPTAASLAAILIVVTGACLWIRRVRRHALPPPSDLYMNGTMNSDKGYGYLPQRYVDMEKARPLSDSSGETESLYPAPYATIPVRDDTFMRKLAAAGHEMKLFPAPPQPNMKDRPLPNPEHGSLKKKGHVYDTAQ